MKRQQGATRCRGARRGTHAQTATGPNCSLHRLQKSRCGPQRPWTARRVAVAHPAFAWAHPCGERPRDGPHIIPRLELGVLH